MHINQPASKQRCRRQPTEPTEQGHSTASQRRSTPGPIPDVESLPTPQHVPPASAQQLHAASGSRAALPNGEITQAFVLIPTSPLSLGAQRQTPVTKQTAPGYSTAGPAQPGTARPVLRHTELLYLFQKFIKLPRLSKHAASQKTSPNFHSC